MKRAKLKGKEEGDVIIHKKQINPSEHIKLVFPSFSNEVMLSIIIMIQTINEVLQRTGNNIEQGIQILKGFVTENKGFVTIPSGTKTININHLMDISPTGYDCYYDVSVTPLTPITRTTDFSFSNL